MNEKKRASSLLSLAGSVRGSWLDLRDRASTLSLPRFSSLTSLVGGRKDKKRKMASNGIKKNDAASDKGNEKLQNSQNHVEEQPLEVTYYCSKIKDQPSVVLQLRPQEPPKRYGQYSSPSASSLYGGGGGGSRSDPVIPRVPLRLVCVIDVSHSMAEPYGNTALFASADEMERVGVSKLDQVKMFTQLLIKSMGQEDFLSIVTFGTKAQVVLPLKKMTAEAKEQASRVIREIEVGGVTNMSAGIFAAVEQFSTDYVKRYNVRYEYKAFGYTGCGAVPFKRYFDDNIILFTDGMANEGIIESKDLLKEIKKKITTLKEECHYEKDYHVKIATLGTGGFLPELLFSVGQKFSSDAFYFLDEDGSMELNLMRPILLRQNSIVTNVKVTLTALNGVLLNNYSTSREFEVVENDLENRADATTKNYHVHDIAADMQKHFCCTLRLPHKHKKQLKGKEILRMEVTYTDSKMEKHTAEKVVHYDDLPKKETMNVEQDVVMTARQCCRLQAQAALTTAATYMKKLNRAGAKSHLEDSMNEIRSYCEYVANFLTGEENYQLLMENYVELLLVNMEHCAKFLQDYMVRWDDAWGRLMALASSLGREVPTASGIYTEDAELFVAPKVQEKLTDLCSRLRDIYAAQGLCTDMLDRHLRMVKELEAKLAEQAGYAELDV